MPSIFFKIFEKSAFSECAGYTLFLQTAGGNRCEGLAPRKSQSQEVQLGMVGPGLTKEVQGLAAHLPRETCETGWDPAFSGPEAVFTCAFSRLLESWIREVLRFRKRSSDSSEFNILIVS